jgi:UDP-glucuronate decarboxylase
VIEPTDTQRRAAERVVQSDLDQIVAQAGSELAEIAGKRLLITGGGGFLGYYLVQAVLEWNRRAPQPSDRIELTVMDNFLRGAPDWLFRSSQDSGLTLVEHDVRQPLPPDLGHFSFVVHAAGIASPTYYRRHPIETMDANIVGLRSLLDRYAGPDTPGPQAEGFLFFSSSEIYGDPAPDCIPTPETYRGNVSCTGPRACYDESKRYGETLCVNFAQQYGARVTIARPFNNYGPGLKISDRRVIPDLARDILAGRDITLLSDGSATRTFCYTADAVVGYYKVLVRGRGGEPYNIGIEEPEISVGDLADTMARLARERFGYEGTVVHRESPEADYLVDNPARRCPLISKAREELGYRPSVNLDDGLTRSLAWYAGNREGSDA